MSTVAGEVQNYNSKAGHRDRIELEMQAAIGAAGAVVSPLTFQDDPGMTVAHGATGVYNLTFPASADLRGSLDVALVSPAGTVRGFWVTAFAPNSGTAQITVVNASGVATDPASGDAMIVQLFLSRLKDF